MTARKKHSRLSLGKKGASTKGEVWTKARWTTPTGASREAVFTGADSPELSKAVRKEIAKRERKLLRVRDKFPPSFISRGKGKRKRLVVNPKFTDAMRVKMHRHAFTAEAVRDELIGA